MLCRGRMCDRSITAWTMALLLVAGSAFAQSPGPYSSTFSANFDVAYHEARRGQQSAPTSMRPRRSIEVSRSSGSSAKAGFNHFPDATVVSYWGARACVPIEDTRFLPFVQMLVGLYHCTECDENDFALQAGGGVDFRLPTRRSFMLRAGRLPPRVRDVCGVRRAADLRRNRVALERCGDLAVSPSHRAARNRRYNRRHAPHLSVILLCLASPLQAQEPAQHRPRRSRSSISTTSTRSRRSKRAGPAAGPRGAIPRGLKAKDHAADHARRRLPIALGAQDAHRRRAAARSRWSRSSTSSASTGRPSAITSSTFPRAALRVDQRVDA